MTTITHSWICTICNQCIETLTKEKPSVSDGGDCKHYLFKKESFASVRSPVRCNIEFSKDGWCMHAGHTWSYHGVKVYSTEKDADEE